jgi:small subunit ribosomal protein S17e
LGKVRTEPVKRAAKELIRRYPNHFSARFEDNKRAVDALIHGATTRVRNQIAGYITHVYSRMETFSSDKETEGE